MRGSGAGWWLTLAALTLALVCYYLPWYSHATAAFTLHAYDLAEWASLHPAVRAEVPGLLTSFLLRLPQVTLLWAIALLANSGRDPRLRTVVRGVAVLVALRFLPPREFLGAASGDPNYRQMALLTGLGLGGTVLAMLARLLPERWQAATAAGVLLLGVLAGWWGLTRTRPLLDNFQIEADLSSGAVGYALLCLAIAGMLLGQGIFGGQGAGQVGTKKGG
jgi:hypothetical protein